MAIKDMRGIIEGFFSSDIAVDENDSFNVYNEASFQHKLGIYLVDAIKKRTGKVYSVDVERDVNRQPVSDDGEHLNFVKDRIDLFIYDSDKNEKYAIELKYPRNGAYKDVYQKFTKDIVFMGQVSELSNVQKTFCLTVTTDPAFSARVFGGGIAEDNRTLYEAYRTRSIDHDIYNADDMANAANKLRMLLDRQANIDDNMKSFLIEQCAQGIIWKPAKVERKKGIAEVEKNIWQLDGCDKGVIVRDLPVYYYLIEIDGSNSNGSASNASIEQ